MSPKMVKEAIAIIDGRSLVEISGGINIATIATYVIEGVDAISVGALTHSAPAKDISLDMDLSLWFKTVKVLKSSWQATKSS